MLVLAGLYTPCRMRPDRVSRKSGQDAFGAGQRFSSCFKAVFTSFLRRLRYTRSLMSVDYYQALGVSRTAEGSEIKVAYRKLALQYHPDRNPGDREAEERFKTINEAYAVLSDPERRGRYDRYGTADPQAQFSGDIFDIFASVFGGGFGGARAGRGVQGEDLEAQLSVTLEQAREGSSVPLSVRRLSACGHCHGERAEPGSDGRQTCPTCQGAGQVRQQVQSFLGTMVTQSLCPTCRGLGERVTVPCTVCRGSGRQEESAAVEVALPKGIDAGYRLRIPRAGNAGQDGGPPGDLYVYIALEPHPQLRREGDDLYYDLPLGFAQAALGSSFEVPTLDGPEVVEVPPGTQPGAEFRLRGKGMPRLRQVGFGDEIVRVQLEVPRKLSPRAKELLEGYAAEMGERIEARETLVGKLKGLFGKKKREEEVAR